MKKYFWALAVGLLVSCSGGSGEKTADLDGSWTAKWETDPAAYEGIDGITDYTMSGQFNFKGDRLNIRAYGFEGCVFNRDTLDHELNWTISGDSLILINEDDVPGMIYTIKSQTDKELKLQLMEDIFLTLNR